MFWKQHTITLTVVYWVSDTQKYFDTLKKISPTLNLTSRF